MKTLLVAILALTAGFRAGAQVELSLALDQDQFLPNEPVRLAVKITNHSGQAVHLGEDPTWLTFSVEAADGFIVMKNSEVPVVEPFDLESSQMATKRVDLQPYFVMNKAGRYKVTATVRIPAWSLTVNSTPKHFDIINGAELWSQNFGVTVANNAPPEGRKYTLIEANYLHDQLRLYLQVGSSDGMNVYKVTALGPMVSFSSPEEQVDQTSDLHVLWQTGAQSFVYATASPNGTILSRDIYDNFNSRPRLGIDTNGNVQVVGGVRRVPPAEVPTRKLFDVPETKPGTAQPRTPQ